jgi:hypothetical protein
MSNTVIRMIDRRGQGDKAILIGTELFPHFPIKECFTTFNLQIRKIHLLGVVRETSTFFCARGRCDYLGTDFGKPCNFSFVLYKDVGSLHCVVVKKYDKLFMGLAYLFSDQHV